MKPEDFANRVSKRRRKVLGRNGMSPNTPGPPSFQGCQQITPPDSLNIYQSSYETSSCKTDWLSPSIQKTMSNNVDHHQAKTTLLETLKARQDGLSDVFSCKSHTCQCHPCINGHKMSPKSQVYWIKIPWVTLTFAMFLFVLHSASYARVPKSSTVPSLNTTWDRCHPPCLNFTSTFKHGQYSRLISGQLGFYNTAHFGYILLLVCSKALFTELCLVSGAAFFVFSFFLTLGLVAVWHGPVTLALARIARSEAVLGGCSVGLSGVTLAMLIFLVHRTRCSWQATTPAFIFEIVPLYLMVHQPYPSTISLHLTGVLVGLALTLITTWTSCHFTKPDWFERTVTRLEATVFRFINGWSTLLCILVSIAIAILSYKLLPPSLRILDHSKELENNL